MIYNYEKLTQIDTYYLKPYNVGPTMCSDFTVLEVKED